MPALHKHLEVAAGFVQKHGPGVLGFWIEEIGTGGQVNYMWIYENIEERQKKLAALGRTPPGESRWRKRRRSTVSSVGQDHKIMLGHPPPSCPEAKMAGNVQSVRLYDAMPGKLPELHNRFANHTMHLFSQHGMEEYRLLDRDLRHQQPPCVLLGYPSLGERRDELAGLGADPEWQRVRAEVEQAPALWVAKIRNRVLRPRPIRLGGKA